MIDERKLIKDIKNLIDSEELAGHSPGSVLHSVCEKNLAAAESLRMDTGSGAAAGKLHVSIIDGEDAGRCGVPCIYRWESRH